jgi:hypothetical protein
VAGVRCAEPLGYAFLPPAVHEVAVIEGATPSLVVDGDNFGADAGDVAVFLEEEPCAVLSMMRTHCRLRVELPAGANVRRRARVRGVGHRMWHVGSCMHARLGCCSGEVGGAPRGPARRRGRGRERR